MKIQSKFQDYYDSFQFGNGEDDEFDNSKLIECTVYHNVKQLDNNQVELTLYAQKVCLDEISMNTLFARYINCFDYTIAYGGYGGEGCEFSISIKKKEIK